MIWLPVVGDYADVDVYASILAYADLLHRKNKAAQVYIPKAPNYSAPQELRLPDLENRKFDFSPQDQAIILGISIPEAIYRLVPSDQILTLIDHHFGYEDYWRREIGERALIEPIGAVATLIFERWQQSQKLNEMSAALAKLLLAAILDNTLNFNAEITTPRDRIAAKELAEIIGLPLADFTAWYFSTVSQAIMEDIEAAILADRKIDETLAFYQLTFWDARELLPKFSEIHQKLDKVSSTWVLNLISVSEGYNYLLTNSASLKKILIKLLNLKPGENGLLISDRLYLRKEILKLMQTQ